MNAEAKKPWLPLVIIAIAALANDAAFCVALDLTGSLPLLS
jgi:hypothetical protein